MGSIQTGQSWFHFKRSPNGLEKLTVTGLKINKTGHERELLSPLGL